MLTRREQYEQEKQEKSKLKSAELALKLKADEEERQAFLKNVIATAKSKYNDDPARAIIALQEGIVSLLRVYRNRYKGNRADAPISLIRKEMMELYIQWQGEMVIHLIVEYIDLLKSHDGTEELCKQLINHNNEFLNKIHNIKSTSWVVDYDSDFSKALEQYQKNYRESISKAQKQLSTEFIREPQTVGECIHDGARRFFNLIDIFFAFIFGIEKTMDETYTPMAQTFTGKTHFFNRTVISIYNDKDLGVKMDNLPNALGYIVNKISGEVDVLRSYYQGAPDESSRFVKNSLF